MKNVPAYEEERACNRVIPCYLFQNTDPIIFDLFILIYLLNVSKRVSNASFLGIKLKSVGL